MSPGFSLAWRKSSFPPARRTTCNCMPSCNRPLFSTCCWPSCSLFCPDTLFLFFCILVLNVVVHLLLDASQTKWASGVLFFVPLTWTLHNWGWFWPESLITVLCTV